MSNQIIFCSTQTARKNYKCDACKTLLDYADFNELSFAEKRELVKAKRDNWEIKKGQAYIRAFMKDNRSTWTFRARPEIEQICQDQDMWID
jgi:hypothetical protein